MWMKLALLAVAGAIGTLTRFGLARFVQQACGVSFPWGTFVVNALGCLLFGIVWMLAEERAMIGEETRFVVLTGFMGAFTTFSTFAFETSELLRDSQWVHAAGNVLGQNVIGIACVFLGFSIGRLL